MDGTMEYRLPHTCKPNGRDIYFCACLCENRPLCSVLWHPHPHHRAGAVPGGRYCMGYVGLVSNAKTLALMALWRAYLCMSRGLVVSWSSGLVCIQR